MRTRFFQTVVGALALALLLTPPSAQAKKKRSSDAEKPETYSAIEDGTLTAPKLKPSSHHGASKKAPVARKSDGPQFDPVPSDQVDPILRRLELVGELIRKHGRAY